MYFPISEENSNFMIISLICEEGCQNVSVARNRKNFTMRIKSIESVKSTFFPIFLQSLVPIEAVGRMRSIEDIFLIFSQNSQLEG